MDALQQLVAAGVQVDSQDNNGLCALHLAAQGGHREAVSLLLATKANPETADKVVCLCAADSGVSVTAG